MMDVRSEIEKRAGLITALGIALFAWFVFESAQFLYSGQFMDLARNAPRFFRASSLLGVYIVFHLVMATAGAFAAIPLILKGRISGLALGIAYRLAGNTIDPLSFLFPDHLLITQSNEPTFLSQGIDVLWLIVSLAILLLYFFLQRQKNSE